MPEGYLARAIDHIERVLRAHEGVPMGVRVRYTLSELTEALVALQAERDTQHARDREIREHAEAIRAMGTFDAACPDSCACIGCQIGESAEAILALLGEPEPDTTLCACPMCPDPRHGEPETDTTKEAAT